MSNDHDHINVDGLPEMTEKSDNDTTTTTIDGGLPKMTEKSDNDTTTTTIDDGLPKMTEKSDNDTSETTTTTKIDDVTPEQVQPLPPMYSPPSPVAAAAILRVIPHGNIIPDPNPPTLSDNVLPPPPAVAINLITDTEPANGLPPPPYAKFPRNNGRETTLLIGPPSHDAGTLAAPDQSRFRDSEKYSRTKNLLVCGMFCAFFFGLGLFCTSNCWSDLKERAGLHNTKEHF